MSASIIAKKNTGKSQKWPYLYALYLGIDSGKLSMSMIKYSFDIFSANSDSATKAMQEWISSPLGASVTTLSICTSMSFSLIANYLDKEDKNHCRMIITIWPYARDSLKSLRNALRGVNSTLHLFYALEIQDARHLIVPIGFVIGILSVLNRIGIRYKSDCNNAMLEENTKLLVALDGLSDLTPKQIEVMRRKIIRPSNQFKALSFFAAGMSGLIDGINPYIGTLALGALSPPMLMFVTAFCGVYFLSHLATKINNEINAQLQLTITQKKIELALLEQEIKFLMNSLTQLSTDMLLIAPDKDKLMGEYLTRSDYLSYKFWEQEKEICRLSLITKDSPVFLKGIKNGLNIYKNIMLTLSIGIFLSSNKIPSLSSANRAILGMSALGTGVIYSLSSSFWLQWAKVIESYYQHAQKIKPIHANKDLTKQENSAVLVSIAKINSPFKNSNTFFAGSSMQQELITEDRGNNPPLLAPNIICYH